MYATTASISSSASGIGGITCAGEALDRAGLRVLDEGAQVGVVDLGRRAVDHRFGLAEQAFPGRADARVAVDRVAGHAAFGLGQCAALGDQVFAGRAGRGRRLHAGGEGGLLFQPGLEGRLVLDDDQPVHVRVADTAQLGAHRLVAAGFRRREPGPSSSGRARCSCGHEIAARSSRAARRASGPAP